MSVESLILRLSDSSNTQTNIWTTNLRRANTFLDPDMPQVAFSQSLWKVYIHYFSLHSDILILPGKMGIQSVHSDFPCKMASKQEIKPMVANLLNIQVIFFGPSEWTNAYLWKTTSISVAVAFVSSCVTASLQEVDCQHDTSEIEQRKKLVVGQPLQIWRLLRYNVWGASRRKLIITYLTPNHVDVKIDKFGISNDYKTNRRNALLVSDDSQILQIIVVCRKVIWRLEQNLFRSRWRFTVFAT